MGAPKWPPYPQALGTPRRSRGAPPYSDRLLRAVEGSAQFGGDLLGRGFVDEDAADGVGALRVDDDLDVPVVVVADRRPVPLEDARARSEEHTSELQSHHDLVCRLL